MLQAAQIFDQEKSCQLFSERRVNSKGTQSFPYDSEKKNT